jgi:hypothetical protein
MSSPYIFGPIDQRENAGDTPGTALLFPVSSRSDIELPRAINAVFYNDESRWPEDPDHPGSNVPISYQARDSVDCALLINYMGRAKGWLPGTDSYIENPPSWWNGGSIGGLDSAGTVPYVNPAGLTDPEFAYAINYLLDL